MNKETGIKGEQVLLCHTPFRDTSMRDQFKNQVILMTARDEKEGEELLKAYGYTSENDIQVITMTEYACLYSSPQITWLIDMPALQDYFMDPVTGESFGAAFPPSFTKVKPFLKET